MSAALLGLVKAERVFDETRGLPFIAFADPYVRGEVITYLREDGILSKEELARRRADPKYAERRSPLFHTRRAFGFDLELLMRDIGGLSVRIVHQDLEVILRQLPPRWEHALRAFHYGECSAVEIGKQLGVSESRVVQLWRLGERRARGMLEAEGLALKDLLP